jgi:DNA polymerase I
VFNLLTTESKIRQAVDKYLKLDALGLDIETANKERTGGALHPRKGNIRLIQFSTDEGVDIIDMFKFPQPKQVFELIRPVLESKIKKSIFNAKFEWQWFKHEADIDIQTMFDCYLVDMMVSNMTTGIQAVKHGLGAVVPRYLKEEMDKDAQDSNWGANELSPRQLEYAARDAQVMLPLRRSLLQRITQFDLDKIAKLEFDAIPAFASIELHGYPVNVEKFTKFHDIAVIDAKNTFAELQAIVRTTRPKGGIQTSLFEDVAEKDHNAVNLNSHVQIKQAFKALGVPIFDPEIDKDLIKKYDDEGKYWTSSTAEKEITPLIHEHPVVKLLLDNRGAAKLVTMVESVLEKTDNGRIYPSIFQIKAETGRTAMHDPNLQQAPGRKDFRGCFEVLSGRKLVIADFSGIEMRVAAHVSQDPVMLKAYRDGLDLHSITHAALKGYDYDWLEANRKGEDKELSARLDAERVFAKTINFGILFGMGRNSYSQRTGLSLAQAQENILKVKTTYPVLTNHLDKAGFKALQTLTSRTLWGRGVKFYAPGNKAKAVTEEEFNAIKAQ